MTLTYEQKQLILAHLTQRAHWQNRFDYTFFMKSATSRERRPERFWQNVGYNQAHMEAYVSPDRTQAYVADRNTGAFLWIKKQGNRILLKDESGRRQAFIGGRTVAQDTPDIMIDELRSVSEMDDVPEGATPIRMNDLGITVHMHASGEKTVFIDGINQTVHFDVPPEETEIKSHPGRFLHAVTFNAAAADEWGLDLHDLLMMTKLIVARDLDIEPELSAFNALKEEEVAALLLWAMTPEKDYSVQVDNERWRPLVQKELGDISALQREWTDVTDFEGYAAGLPRRFALRWIEDGFDLLTSFDHREQILAQGSLLDHARLNDTQALSTLAQRLSPSSLLHMLENGAEVKDHRGRQWHYVIFENDKAGVIAHLARLISRERFDLTGYHFAAIAHKPDACLLGMDSRKLAEIRAAYTASLDLRAMIHEGSEDTERMFGLLEQGASLRLVAEEIDGGTRTFANEMYDAGATKLLLAYQERFGDRDLGFRVPPLPAPGNI